MLKLYRFEMKKIHRTTSLWVSIAVFALICLAINYVHADAFLTPATVPSQEEQQKVMSEMTKDEKEEYLKQIEWQTMLSEGASSEQLAAMSEEERAAYESIRAGTTFTYDKERAQYEIENNINSGFGIPSFIENAFANGYMGMFMIFIAVIISALIAKEYNNSTIKISLLSPHKRSDIIISKILCIFTVILEFMLITALLCAVESVIFFMAVGKTNPEPFNCMKEVKFGDTVTTMPVLARLAAVFGISVLSTFMVALAISFISVISKNVVLTIMTPVATFLVPMVVTSDKITSNVLWKYVFFNLIDNYLIISPTSRTNKDLAIALVVTVIWAILFAVGSIVAFEKQDVYN
ncbi:MAG: ABC transporter permease subunit [Clostridia bacterium]|nr:ABC transporter permease subunit [Clostridia bacterium]